MGEAEVTIFTSEWDEAWLRVPALAVPLREAAARCGEEIRRGWADVAPLAGVVAEAVRSRDATTLRRTRCSRSSLRARWSTCSAPWPLDGWDGVLDRRVHAPDDLDGDLSLLRRFLLMTELACESPEVGAEMRTAIRGHAPALLRWCDEAAPELRRFAAALPA